MVQTQVQLTEEQAEALQALARARGQSVAELIQQSVAQFLGAGQRVDMAERRRRALALSGRFHAGVADLADEHDTYLTEDYV